MAAIEDEFLTKLVDGALDVLHHDRTEGSVVDKYERDMLRRKFIKILGYKR